MRSRLLVLALMSVLSLAACTTQAAGTNGVLATAQTTVTSPSYTSTTVFIGHSDTSKSVTNNPCITIRNAPQTTADDNPYCTQTAVIPGNRQTCVMNAASYVGPRSLVINGQMIAHPRFVCHVAFAEVVDFSYLGDFPGCFASQRPCSEIPKVAPIYPGNRVAGFAPVEGRDKIAVSCQAEGTMLHEGLIAGHHQGFSAIWDFSPGVGWYPDLWLGNQGWRGIPCH